MVELILMSLIVVTGEVLVFLGFERALRQNDGRFGRNNGSDEEYWQSIISYGTGGDE